MLMFKSIRVLPKFKRRCFSTFLLAASAIVALPAHADSFLYTRTYTFNVGDLLTAVTSAAGASAPDYAYFNFLFSTDDLNAVPTAGTAPSVPSGDAFSQTISAADQAVYFTKIDTASTIAYLTSNPTDIFSHNVFNPSSADALPRGWGGTSCTATCTPVQATFDYAIPTTTNFTVTLGSDSPIASNSFFVEMIAAVSLSSTTYQESSNKPADVFFDFTPTFQDTPEPAQVLPVISACLLLGVRKLRKRA